MLVEYLKSVRMSLQLKGAIMGRIKILDETVSNIIAAGEVVENPASMIKELLENSLDAGSTAIRIEVRNSGRDVIISDNGVGMSQEDLFLSIERHATSKIFTKEDIFNLHTYGFRGEALASIASVSKVKLSSKREEDEGGNSITVLGGKVTSHKERSMNRGTEIEVRELFFNTPARLKFLRKKGTEYAKIKEIVLKEALVSPEVAFTLYLDGREVIKTSGRGMQNTILELFNKNTLKNLVEFPLGYLGNLELTRATRDHIYTYVNGRYVKSTLLEKAVIDGYYTKLTKGRYPFVIIFLQIDPHEVDVNVHPSKKVVKFSEGNTIYEEVLERIKEVMEDDEEIVSPVLTTETSTTIDLSEFADLLGESEKPASEEADEEEVAEEIQREVSQPKEAGEKRPEKAESTPEKPGPPEVREERRPFTYTPAFKDEVIKTQEIPLIEEKELPKGGREIYREESPEQPKSVEREGTVPPLEKPLKKREKDFRVIGQFYNSYILVERDGTLEIYDQHIVQERTLYEELKEKHYNKSIGKQSMLVPLKFSLDYEEKRIVDEHRELLDEFGFEVEDFGDREVLLRSAPVFDFRTSIENTFRYMIEMLREDTGIVDFREKILISMSCRNSIKAGEPLNHREMEILIEKLHNIGKYTCPHGRPIIVKLPLEELEKKFKRR